MSETKIGDKGINRLSHAEFMVRAVKVLASKNSSPAGMRHGGKSYGINRKASGIEHAFWSYFGQELDDKTLADLVAQGAIVIARRKYYYGFNETIYDANDLPPSFGKGHFGQRAALAALAIARSTTKT